MKLKFIDGEGYLIKISGDSLDNCSLCKCVIDDDEIFYLCKQKKVAYCENCGLRAPCMTISNSIIPSAAQIKDTHIHMKIIGKRKDGIKEN